MPSHAQRRSRPGRKIAAAASALALMLAVVCWAGSIAVNNEDSHRHPGPQLVTIPTN